MCVEVTSIDVCVLELLLLTSMGWKAGLLVNMVSVAVLDFENAFIVKTCPVVLLFLK